MNEQEKVDKTRRNLVVATSVVGGAASVGAAVPFLASMWPSERARAAGAPVEMDVSRIPPGELAVIEWRGKPVWVLRRTKEMITSLKTVEPRLSDPQSKASEQPKYAQNEYRSATPDLLVLVGASTPPSTTRRRTSTSGISSARSPCWCSASRSSRGSF